MYACAAIIPVMVPRRTVLALVSILGPVLIYKRDHQKLNILAQPGALLVIRQNRFDEAFYHVIWHHLTGVVPRRQQYTVTRRMLDAADTQFLHAAPLACHGQLTLFQKRRPFEPLKKTFPVTLCVDHAERKPYIPLRRSERIREAARSRILI